ncbi:hypothetical protein VCHENC02_5506A, partial [Vibrio harveyi]
MTSVHLLGCNHKHNEPEC